MIKATIAALLLALSACSGVPREHLILAAQVEADIGEQLRMFGEPSPRALLNKNHVYRVTSYRSYGRVRYYATRLEVLDNGEALLFDYDSAMPTKKQSVVRISKGAVDQFKAILNLIGYWSENRAIPLREVPPSAIEGDGLEDAPDTFCAEEVWIHLHGGGLWVEAVRANQYYSVADDHVGGWGPNYLASDYPEYHLPHNEALRNAIYALSRGEGLSQLLSDLLKQYAPYLEGQQ